MVRIKNLHHTNHWSPDRQPLVKKGIILGATDEIGALAIDIAHPSRDFYLTLLHLLRFDENKPTYFHAGRLRTNELDYSKNIGFRPIRISFSKRQTPKVMELRKSTAYHLSFRG